MSKAKEALDLFKFEETKEYEKGFSDYFEKNVKTVIQPTEEKRLELLSLLKKRKKIFFGVLISLFIVFIISSSDIIIPIFILAAIALGIWAFYLPRKEYKKIAKQNVLSAIVNFYGDFKYQHDGEIQKDLKNFKIIPAYDISHSEDYISGKYKNVGIEMSEVKLEQKHESYDEEGGSQTTYQTVFKGLFILVDMNKKFKGQTIVKTDMGKLFNWLRNKFTSLETVTLEDPTFEKMYEVYSDNQVEARYILTTAFMQRLNDLTEVYGTKKIQVSFLNDEVFIMLPCKKDLFEPKGIYSSIIDSNEIHKFLAHMYYVFQIIDILKMNKKIGM